MKRIALPFFVLAFAPTCDKQDKSTEPPSAAETDASPPSTASTPTPEPEPDTPTEPDPPEIATAAHHYLLGHYDETISTLEPLVGELESRQQYRASGLAAGWLALGHAQIVFENAEGPYRHALAMAERTQDPDVAALAKLAHGAFLLGQEDFDAAKEAFKAAASARPASLPGALANILRAETLIGSAYGSGASDTLERPADLEEAKQAYAAAATTARTGVETDIILGRVEEGLAAIAKFQRDKQAACTHAQASVEHLQAAEASDFLIDGPYRILSDFHCE